MYIKKYLVGYILLTVCLPATVFLGNLVGTPLLKGVSACVLVLCAIVNLIYSGRTIKYVFGNRGHNKVDVEFVVQVIIATILLFCVRYIASCFLVMHQIPKFVIYFVMSPFIILIAAPFMKNYCLNKKTIQVAIICAFILMFFVIPGIIFAIETVNPGNNFILDTVYKRYYIYESASNVWIMNITELMKVNLSDKVLLIVINIMPFIMWCLTFLPYIVINCIVTDELTYMEFCKKLTGLNIMTICVTIVGLALVCCVLANSGNIDILYSLKHY